MLAGPKLRRTPESTAAGIVLLVSVLRLGTSLDY